MVKTITSYSYFLHKIDIYSNKPRRPAANFFDTLTIFSGNDGVTRFDGTKYALKDPILDNNGRINEFSCTGPIFKQK